MNSAILVIVVIVVVICIFAMKRRKDNFTFPENNMTYWPQYYYSFPYNYKNGGIWPPGMYNRLNFWSPGYYTGSGLSWENRPGMGEKWWPRNRWINHAASNSYYDLSNNGDWTHDAANYNNPLFMS